LCEKELSQSGEVRDEHDSHADTNCDKPLLLNLVETFFKLFNLPVFAALTAKTGKPAGVFVTQDILARTLLKLQTGVDPGSPVAVGMTLVPSDPAAFASASTALEAAVGVFVSLGYTVE